jgi:hypothetical protein
MSAMWLCPCCDGEVERVLPADDWRDLWGKGAAEAEAEEREEHR